MRGGCDDASNTINPGAGNQAAARQQTDHFGQVLEEQESIVRAVTY